MWPWEHPALGYLLYSGYARFACGERPVPGDASVVVVATQLPDLVDKPLAWTAGVLPSGISLAHSALVAVPVAVDGVLLARSLGRRSLGRAFALGYLSHLVGDLLYPLGTDGSLPLEFLVWSLAGTAPVEPDGSIPMVLRLPSSFDAFLATPWGQVYLALEVGLLGAWRSDGFPGLRFATG